MVQLPLIKVEHITDTIWAFEFGVPKDLDWEPGQFIKIAVPHSTPDAGGTSRFYTIASAPHEGVIRIATRTGQSTFKSALFALIPGESVELAGYPAGGVVWGEHQGPRVLAASGIGITPFFAMLEHRAHLDDLATPVHLVYFHRHTPLPFADKLNAWQQRYPMLRVTSFTKDYTPEQLAIIVPNLKDSYVYLSGPMSPTKLLLPPYNLKPSQIVRDTFTGYASTDY